MYKYEQQEKRLYPHKSKSVEQKGTIEFKRDLTAEPKIKVEKAMGVSANSTDKSHAYIQRAELDRCSVQLKKKKKNQQAEEEITEFTADSFEIPPNMKDRITLRPRQSPIKIGGVQYYHLEGRYVSGTGKPIWIITPDKKIKVIGLYEHYRNSNKKYTLVDGVQGAPGSITIP